MWEYRKKVKKCIHVLALLVYIVTMKKLTSLFLTFTASAFLMFANEPMEPLTIATDSINSFDTKLYQTLSATNGNVNYSAISIYSLLYALQNGAEGITKDQINMVISLEPTEVADTQIKKIITATENMTNSLWYKKSLQIQSTYEQFTKDYDFIIKPTDFYQGPKVRKEINAFISEKTEKLIENFLQEDLPVATQLVLLNTLYFNQKWKSEFDEEATFDQPFYKTKEKQTTVKMMHKTTSIPYYQDEVFQIAEFAYKDSRYSMIVFLPYDYEYDFTQANINALLQKFCQEKSYSRVKISFPKFDITSKYDLIPILQGLGMTAAFDPTTSNLSKIFLDGNNLYVDAAIHQVRIQVNEKETKAAAVTMFGMKATSAMPQPSIPFTADHPFAYVIRDNETGINLFTGIVREPK